MTRLLTRMLGRLPLGWLQLITGKLRFTAAAAGVTFACILVFVQLGMMGAFAESTRMSYGGFDADIMISASDADDLTSGSNVARRRMFQALAVPGVSAACPLFIALTPWEQDDGTRIEFRTIGIDPSQPAFFTSQFGEVDALKLANNVLLDSKSRGLKPDLLAGVTPDQPFVFETKSQQLAVVGTIAIGGGFTGDGFMIVSDQTFMRMFSARFSGAPNHILLKVDSGKDAQTVVDQIRTTLNTDAIKVRTFADAIQQDVSYQTTKRPVGLIFGFGVAIGIVVGIVIVYQILSTDVLDHLREYATFKAMGYSRKYFRSVILEEAVILAVAGFFPALLVTLGIYTVMANATGLPIAMSIERAAMVFLGAVASCALSGMIALRKLVNADPADLF